MTGTPTARPGAVTRRATVLALALALTLLDAATPVTVDDPAYLRQASWWAAHPLDPLGGEALHYQTLVPAARNAAAPVAIGWLAIGVRLFGRDAVALKLWLFPFAWLLVWALDRLLQRLAPDLRAPALTLAAVSPAIVGSFHLMLDVPALALGLAALAVLAAGDPPLRWRAAVIAGVLAGLALQTKYSAIGVVVAVGAYALLEHGAGAAALTTGVTLAVFATIEAALYGASGTSPLLAYIAGRGARDPGGHVPLVTAKKLVLMAGSAGSALIPFGLVALGASRRQVRMALAMVVAGWLLFAAAPGGVVAWLDGLAGGRWINFENVTLGWMGPVLVVVAALAALAVWRAGALARATVLWLLAEGAIAPFVSASASVRRVIGALVALTLLLAALARRRVEREPQRRADLGPVVACGVLLTLGSWLADRDSALAEQRALELARARVAVHGGGRMAYVADHWGAFQYQAERAGLVQVTADRAPLVRGDWLLVPFNVEMRGVALDLARVRLVDSVPLPHMLPLTTHRSFYDGRLALRRPDPAWIGARLYRVERDGLALRSR
jgi:hypothetical protein